MILAFFAVFLLGLYHCFNEACLAWITVLTVFEF
jgi:hypothetical protein